MTDVTKYTPKLVLAAAVAATSTLTPVPASAQEYVEKPWGIAVELGASATTGNTETLSIQSKADVRHETARWENKYTASVLFKEDEVVGADGTVGTQKTAEKYFLSARAGYKLEQEHTNIFGFASHTEDEFGAFENYTTAAAGYGARWLDRPAMNLDVELGPGYFRGERATVDDNVEVEKGVMLRGAGEFQWSISETAKFAQTISVETASDNTRTISDTSISTTLTDTLQMKVGYSVFHNSNVAPDKEATDTTTFINLVYDL